MPSEPYLDEEYVSQVAQEQQLVSLPIEDTAPEPTDIEVVDEPLSAAIPAPEAILEGANIEMEAPATDSLLTALPQQTAEISEEEPLPIRIVQQIPEFPGGMSAFTKWLTRNLRYPEQSQRYKTQGMVVVSFVVNKDGTASDIKIEKSAEARLDAEVIRVMKLMPKWQPGMQDNQPCRTILVVPVSFRN